MAFQFPASPLLGDQFSPAPGLTYEYDGVGWIPITSGILTLGEGDERWLRLDGLNEMSGYLRIEHATGYFGRFVDLSGAVGHKNFGFQMGSGNALFGKLTDDEAAFTQWLQFASTGRMSAFAPNGFSVSEADLGGEFFLVDNVGQTIVSYPSTNDGTAHISINGGQFYISRNGAIQNNQSVVCGAPGYGTGSAQLSCGSGVASGYMQLYNPAGTPIGYIGVHTPGAGNKIPIWTNTAAAHGWAFMSSRVSIADDSNQSSYNSAQLSVNISTHTDVSPRSGITVHNVGGGGSALADMTFMWNSNVVGSIITTNVATTYNTTSDGRLKDNVQAMGDVGAMIDALRPVMFTWKRTKQAGRGFIAQEVHKLVPEAVAPPVLDMPWQMDFSKLMPYVIAELQSLRKRVDFLGG